MVDGSALEVEEQPRDGSAGAEPLSKEEALKRFLARKAAAKEDPDKPRPKRASDECLDEDKRPSADDASADTRRELKKAKQDRHDGGDSEQFPVSKHSHFDLVPGHQNTTTKEPMKRPPDMRLVTALASKGKNLAETMRKMNMGPSGRPTMLQTLTTRDVVMIPDLFEPSSGFVMPPDPWDNGTEKTIYQRLVEEIHHAGKHEARARGGNPQFQDKCFSTDKDGIFKTDDNGLFKAWHKTTPQAAGDGLASGRDGNGHLIVNDRDERWRMAQQRGEAPMYTAVRAGSLTACLPVPYRPTHCFHTACAVTGARANRRVFQDEDPGQAVWLSPSPLPLPALLMVVGVIAVSS